MSSSWKNCCSCFQQRWVTVALCFLGSFNAYTMRICLSIAITEMTVPTVASEKYSDDTCPDTNEVIQLNKNATIDYDSRFHWDEKTQGLILSSFYWGYFMTNVIGGVISDKFGGKHALGFGVLSSAILTLLTPISVQWGGAWALITIRLLMGIGEGQMYPALNVLMARWIPENERSFAGSWAFSGGAIGSIVGMAVSGAIIRYSDIGWPAVFYFFGILGLFSYLLNCIFCYSRPSDNPFISEAELQYLKQKLKNTHADLPPTPWGHILRSKAVWALLIVTIGKAWGLFTIISDMPKYMSSVLKFSVDSNGYISSIPTLFSFISTCVASWIADKIIAKKLMSTIKVRKIGASIAMIGTGVFLVATSYAGCNSTVAVILYTIGMTLFGFSNFGIMVNALDLAPNYAGTLLGYVFGIATIGGFLSPYVAGVMTPNQTISEWRSVFWIVLIIFIVTNTAFLLYGSADVQEWNDPDFLRKKKNSSEIKEDVELLPVKR